MPFITDRQTLDDLNIFGKGSGGSIYGVFNQTRTRGGAALLEQYFNEPLSQAPSIRKRIDIIRYFTGAGTDFPFLPEWFDQLEQYLANTDERSKLIPMDQGVGQKLAGFLSASTEQAIIQKGITAAVEIVRVCREICDVTADANDHWLEERATLWLLLSGAAFVPLLSQPPKKKLTAGQLAEYDELLRFRFRNSVRKLLDVIYRLDVYQTVARVAVSRGLAFPVVVEEGVHVLDLKGLYHPGLEAPVPNSVEIGNGSNIIFLTGANMAGKSTFMKSLGIVVYLAHMGFPVPAAAMRFSLLDGLFTTINLADNLAMGASHFYAEVLRVKKVIEELRRGRKLLVIFDELFRGTNVKDAYDATIAVTSAFSARSDSVFLISTHIMEAGEVLRQRYKNIRFIYLPTRMDGTKPVYTYQLGEGISDDRHGMLIIRNEGIPEILEHSMSRRLRSGPEGITTPGGDVTDARTPGFVVDAQPPGFVTDAQTLNDLNLVGRYRRGSIYSLFCKVVTAQGERLLDELFRQPLVDAEAINRRSALFRYFGSLGVSFPVSREVMEKMEGYLQKDGGGGLPVTLVRTLRRRITASLMRGDAETIFRDGFSATLRALREMKVFLERLDEGGPYDDKVRGMLLLLEDRRLAPLLGEIEVGGLPLTTVAQYDHLLRTRFRDRLLQLVSNLAEMDVWIAVGNLARANGWVYAEAMDAAENLIRVDGLRHPGLAKGVENDIDLDANTNMLFLTGANMAGKSTFMKSFGIAVYLAHMGFPVAAAAMQFSVRDGLFSSINVADDISLGHSHFYAEVLRVKEVAKAVASGKRLVVLFDELFKGTNVRDAYDGTLGVTRAFSGFKGCAFIISTHITEAGEVLSAEEKGVRFAYLPSLMEEGRPRYTYVLRQGIATDRVGMMIIENEGILELI